MKKIRMLLYGCFILISLSAGLRKEVYAGIQEFEDPKENPYLDPVTGEEIKIDFLNGSFEIPNITTDNVPGASTPAGPDVTVMYVPELCTPEFGWRTRPVYEEDIGVQYWNYIEIQRRNYDYYFPKDGFQYAELNAAVEGRLYQYCNTVPNQKVYYEYYHKGRNGEDVMDFYLSAPGEVNSALARSVTDNDAWKRYYGAYTIPEGQTVTEFAFVSVKAEGGDKALGNFLDAISLSYPSFVVIEKTVQTESRAGNYALPGEVVSYTIKIKNEGETATSRTVMTDVLPDGVTFLTESLNITYTEEDGPTLSINKEGLYQFDSGTDTLTVQTGKIITGAVVLDENENEVPNTDANGTYSIEKNAFVTVSFDVLVTGEGISYGDTIENQVKVTYNDLGYERFNLNELGNIEDSYNVSNISGFSFRSFVSFEIQKELSQSAAYNQSFVFEVIGRKEGEADENTFYLVISIPAGQTAGSIRCNSLRPGEYSVTEIDSRWEYALEDESSRIQLKVLDDDEPDGVYTYKNTAEQNSWISGNNEIRNEMTAALPF